MLERKYQSNLIKKLKKLFPGCYILKNDPTYFQGIPDILILFRDRWAALEVKRSQDEPEQPNQGYHIEKLDEMSFASFVYPENEEEVIHALQQIFRV